MNGERVIATCEGTNYVRLPKELQRPIGAPCHCPHCKGASDGMWDTLAVPPTGHTWTAHIPDSTVLAFREYAAKQVKKSA